MRTPTSSALSWTAPLSFKMVQFACLTLPLPAATLTHHSAVVQLVAYISAKMSNSPHEDCRASLYWREIPNHRSYHPFLWHIQTFPEQRSVITADGLPHPERTCTHSRRCYHVYKH